MRLDEPHNPKPLGRRVLEARLRRLPGPKVPEHLEADLLAAIPAGMGHAKAASSGGRRWLAAGAGLAAAVALFYLAVWPYRPAPSVARRRAILDDTSPEHIIGPTVNTHKRETDPCAILPPLPDWYSPPASSSQLRPGCGPIKRPIFS